MIIADWVVIGLIIFFCLIGFIAGFGRGLKFFTSGFFGFIISIIICYCLGGFIFRFAVIQELIGKLNTLLINKNNTVCKILLTIRIDMIAYYVSLFIIVSIIRIILVSIIKSLVEVENVFFKFINRTLGMVLFVFVLAVLVLFVFNIINIIGGTTEANFCSKYLVGSKLKLDVILEKRLLMEIIEFIKIKLVIKVPA